MRSRAARLTLGAVAWIALAPAGLFIVRSEQQLATVRNAVRTFDLRAREAADALSDLRAAQQAYVALGQGVAFWMPKVAQTAELAVRTAGVLRQSATTVEAKSALDEVAARLAEFAEVDKRARDYLNLDQQLMAGDVIFTEGGQAAAAAARQVEAARLAEHRSLDAAEAAVRWQQAVAIGGAAALAALIVLLLTLLPTSTAAAAADVPTQPAASGLRLGAAPAPSRGMSPVLKAAAGLCTDFGRLRDIEDLSMLLEKAADAMDAGGLVVWLGNTAGADLQPVLTHGYSDQMRARLPHVPRSADNAAAAAYRAGALQIVLSRPGVSSGALVAPILSPDGCVGALSAEIRDGGEGSESIQALAVIVAAQLATVLATSAQATPAAAPAEGQTRATGGAAL